MAPDAEPQWPPRSPHEALLSTPGGRQRYRELLNQTSPSPSPSRRRRLMAAASMSPGSGLGGHFDEDDDEDEETLQLKLQEIQARLRLKKLQNAKNKENSLAKTFDEDQQAQPPASGAELRRNARASTPGTEDSTRLAVRSQVQVPASPIRRAQAPMQQTSPSRVLLGIDKGLKAKDISLKRAPSAPGARTSRGGGYLEKSRSSNSVSATQEAPRPLSFNERLASARTEEAFRATREEKIRQVRTNAFGIDKQEMEEYKKRAVDISDEPIAAPSFTRDQIMSKGKASGSLPRSRTVPNVASHADIAESSSFTEKSSQDVATGEGEEGASSFESYSCFHLSRRIVPHRVLARHVSGKKMMNIKELLRDVKAPDFELPDVEQDIVVFAIVAKKSEPRAHKQSEAKKGRQDDRGKYMVMTLCDLDFELDLFLFNSGFTRFWKLTEGTVVAILNPTVMPPPPGRQDTGRFSLVINSDADTIIEIGAARDLGFCQSVKKDGDLCSAWVNKKRTQFCEFHANEAVRKQRSTRMEVNTSGFGDRGRRGGRGGRGGGSKEWDSGRKKGPDNYDWETRTQWFASRSFSAADLIDGKDRAPADRKEKSEFLKRSMEAKEKEREMMKQLGKVGNAAGREYMLRAGEKKAGSVASSASLRALTASGTADEPPKLDAASLGLQSKDRAIHLSPIKRKRPESSQAGSTAGSARGSAVAGGGFGWGSSLRNKLSSMKDGEKLHTQKSGSKSPVRKKTRFVTEKGIREAGRESLGMDAANADVAGRQLSLDDDDDDELIIVK
ncbi:DNA replication licensing factor mcm10 [Purpureocillium lilacinum]|uniref:DNA replication licensing factor mcm10 n=1 Tax=Purpureocillium lilacinum TaxID=33203 RepID=A0A179HPK7_PURLI|nr:DNA replication licensing factor mcm10 [Purpureocillium lilacinum]OAQ92267.1 DNA replication licensing factor mcm10 [Purpureocillium lilacinum]